MLVELIIEGTIHPLNKFDLDSSISNAGIIFNMEVIYFNSLLVQSNLSGRLDEFSVKYTIETTENSLFTIS